VLASALAAFCSSSRKWPATGRGRETVPPCSPPNCRFSTCTIRNKSKHMMGNVNVSIKT
jgi:hypothetical protein